MAGTSNSGAVSDPTAAFSSPRDVLNDPSLNKQEKFEALTRWKQAENDLERAASEGMEPPPGAARASRLDEINKALQSLEPEPQARRD